jgi:hypothetical protein
MVVKEAQNGYGAVRRWRLDTESRTLLRPPYFAIVARMRLDVSDRAHRVSLMDPGRLFIAGSTASLVVAVRISSKCLFIPNAVYA